MEMIVLSQPGVRTSSLGHVMFVAEGLNNSQVNRFVLLSLNSLAGRDDFQAAALARMIV